MFIFNINFNKNKIRKLLYGLIIIAMAICIIVFLSTTIGKSKRAYVKDDANYSDINQIPVQNYTSILKDCSENLDNYVR